MGHFRLPYSSTLAIRIANLFLLMGILTLPLLGQVSYEPKHTSPLSEPWRWRPIEILSAKGVRSMTDDVQGNMWFGLNKGVIRYDGYNWKLYDNQPCLKSPIGILRNTTKGDLYAASESGLLQFKNEVWSKVFPSIDSVNIAVTAITEAANGSLLVGVQNGLVQIHDGNTTIFTVLSRVNSFRQSNPDARIITLPDEILFNRNFGRIDEAYQTESGRIWLFMSRNNDGKLLQFNPQDTVKGLLTKFEIKTEIGGFPLPNRNQLLKTSNGDTWIINGFYKSGILKQSGKKWTLLKLSDTFGGDELHTDIMEVSDGSLWIGGLGKLYEFDKGKWNIYSAPTLPIPSSRIIFHEAQDGSIWIAGVQGDVFRLSYNNDKWLKYKGVNFQLCDRNGREWFIASDGKVLFKNKNSWFAFDQQSGLIDAPVKLVSSRNGRIWVIGSHQTVAATAYLDNGRWHKQIHPKLSWGIDPRSVFIDRNGSLWLGASVDRQEHLGQISGILQLQNPDGDSLVWRHYTQQDGIVQHNVYGIGQSPDGRIWAGGTNLINFTPPRWQPFTEVEHFNEFIDIVHSSKNLWVGSRYYGIFRYDGSKWSHYTKNQGLPSNTIISIYEESPERVWAITDKDIAWFDGKIWSSGLFSEEFRIPREGGEILAGQNGEIWINKALREWKRRAFPYSVAPAEAYDDFWTVRYTSDRMPPRTTISVYSETVDQSGNTLIGWIANDHWENTPSHLITYSYRLNDEEWSDFSLQTNIVLTKLSSGKHTFEVRARDLDNNIETTPARITFTVKPPIWKQPWFIVLVVSFLITIGFYETRLIQRNRSLFRLNQILSEVNQKLETRKEKIERQKEQILQQKEELERKNITLEEQNEEIMKQRDKLQEMVVKVEELSSIKQRFFTNISHEFRTPLTLILGSIEQLLSAPGRTERAKLTQAYEIIQRNSRRILRLINQILDIRKIEMGKLELRPQNGDIVAFSKEIVFMFNDLAHKQSINLHIQSTLPTINTQFDPDIIEKILFNLLSNAFKSTPRDGEILVLIETKELEEKSTINFTVYDTGQGIPKQFIDHIFDRFYQLSEANCQQKYDGSGIGLSLVKDLVTTHNGNIDVMSQLGEGTSFCFSIPFNSPKIDDEETTKQIIGPSEYIADNIKQEIKIIETTLEQARISEERNTASPPVSIEQSDKLLALIVEDEFEFREFIREILEEEFEMIEASNGLAGYNQAIKYQPDIIITDVMMPEMNGIELCEKLKENLITNHIPVVMLTARSSPEHKLEGYQTGADAYIEKPFNREYLRIRINNLVQAKDKTREKILRDLTTQPEEVAVHSEDDKMLRRIREVLEENIGNSDFDVETMSQLFCLSRFHFSRKIKQLTGLNPKEIIDSFRLKRAAQILVQQKLSISEVAYMVGFDHPNSFTRAFRKYFGVTPTEYITQNLS